MDMPPWECWAKMSDGNKNTLKANIAAINKILILNNLLLDDYKKINRTQKLNVNISINGFISRNGSGYL
jgi:hypothetical protein